MAEGLPRNDVLESLRLKDLIHQITEELIESNIERQERGQPPLFQVEKLTIEAHIIVTKTSEAKGGLNVAIVTVGGGTKFADQQVQKITLELKLADSLRELLKGQLDDLLQLRSGALPGAPITPPSRPRPHEDMQRNTAKDENA